MKYIVERNEFDKNDIRKALNQSLKSGDIKMKISPDDFIDNVLNRYHPEMDSFEHIVLHHEIISMGDEKRIKEFIIKFKELKIDVSKLEKLFPKYQEYLNFPLDPPEEYDYMIHYKDQKYYTHTSDEDPEGNGWYREDEESKKEYETDLENWYTDEDRHALVREEFNTEVKRLLDIAKKIIFKEL